MGIRNCLEQNLLENKEQKEDVTRACFIWSVQLPPIFEQKRPYNLATIRFFMHRM